MSQTFAPGVAAQPALAAPDAPRELQPLIAATNEHMRRQSDLLAQQQRFVRDASHQLRTPLALPTAQVQSARRGDVRGSHLPRT